MSVALVFAVIPVSFACRNLPPRPRIAVALVLATLSLGYPLLLELPRSSPNSMMAVVVPFQLVLVSTRLLLASSHQARATCSSLLQEARYWSCEFLWFMLPLVKSKVPPNERGFLQYVMVPVLHSVVWAVVKFAVAPLIVEAMLAVCDGEQGAFKRPRDDFYLLVLWFGSVIAGMWVYDMLNGVVTLLTVGRYSVVSFTNYPLLSTSISDFWSRRYNLQFHTVLHRNVFLPLQSAVGLSPFAAGIVTFFVSGLLHGYIAHVTFPSCRCSFLLFFLLHGVGCAADRKLFGGRGKALSPGSGVLRAAVTPVCLSLTSALLLGAMKEGMPQWLQEEPQAAPPNALSEVVAPFARWAALSVTSWLP